MTYANAQYQNRGNDEGDVLNFFNDKLRNLVQKNSGDNTFSIVQENCHDKDEPVPLNTKTKLRLSHSAHTISQIEKGFIELLLRLEVELEDIAGDRITIDKEFSHLNYLFIGFKDAVEIISEVFFWVDGRLVDNYHQNEMVRESFAYNSIRPKDAKKANPHSHALWEDVCMMSPNVCGVYIPLTQFIKPESPLPSGKSESDFARQPDTDGTAANRGVHKDYRSKDDFKPVPVKIEMKLCIPFTDQLVLQAWRLYPNRILGEIEEEVKFALNGLVWCQVPPKEVAEVKKFWGLSNDLELSVPNFLPTTNHFTQIGQKALIVSDIHYLNCGDDIIPFYNVHGEIKNGLSWYAESSCASAKMTILKGKLGNGSSDISYTVNTKKWSSWKVSTARLKFNPNSCQISTLKTHCAGFGIKQDVIKALMEAMNEPIIIPAQELTRHQYEGHADKNGIVLSKTVPLRNATNITMMFPLHSEDCTVFQNINYKNVKLIVNKRTYPETEFDNTWDGRFVQYQLMANELDGMIEPTREFVESITRPLSLEFERKETDADTYRTANEPPEGKRFKMSPFDNTSFGINFQLERGNAGYVFDGIDTGSHTVTIEFRGHPDIDADLDFIERTSAPPPPEMWVCSDTYWTWSVQDGVRYYARGIPAGYE